jgi:O-antigen ligase/tetratricopeptide (TPR) repeat protein
MTAKASWTNPTRSHALGWATLAAFIALAYFVLLGGTAIGELDPALRSLNAVIAACLLVRYVWRMPMAGDRIDRGVLVAVVLFAIAGILSHALRQSFDAVLEAATYAAALFTARDLLAREPVRAAFVRLLMGLSLLLTLVAAFRWFPLLIGWWLATDRTVLPPLNFELSGIPWGHRYDLALTLVVLYPAWWVRATSPLRRLGAVIVGILAALIVLIVGSRTLWAALGIATLLVGAPTVVRVWRRNPQARGILVGGILAILVLIVLSGVAAALLQRASSATSVGWRTAMWGPLLEVWARNPIAGYGPGSFPWILQLTNYFDTNTWAPRHPDSVPLQLVAEAGLLGILSVVVVVATLLPPILRGRSDAARFVAFTIAVASFGANPTEFPFLMAVVIGWVAFVIPHETKAHEALRGVLRPLPVASFIALGVVAAAYLATLGAAFSYESARSAVVDGDLDEARRAFDVAISFDPSLALYRRQRGELAYLEGDAKDAAADLQEATRLNPSDDLAWRVLALASSAMGKEAGAQAALARAVATQRSDVTNLLLSARWLGQHDHIAEAREVLGEVIQSWPAIVAAPGWQEMLPASVTTNQTVQDATRRWALGLSTPALDGDQGLWLAAMGNRPDLDGQAIGRAMVSRPLAEAELALLRCGSADDLLNHASDEDKRSAFYWISRLRAAALARRSDEAAVKAIRFMTGDFTFPGDPRDTLNPLNENGVLSADAWGYRRAPINWPDSGVGLPNPGSGAAIWLLDPIVAVRNAGLAAELPACQVGPTG